MIYLADDSLVEKVVYMRKKHQLNISALIRDFLEKKYSELKKNEDNTVNEK
jgi:hypothetical protein